MKKIIGKKPKINLKKKEIYANFELETRFQALQNTVLLIFKVYDYRKPNYKQKNGPLRRKNG